MIGSFFSATTASGFQRTFHRLFGVPDFHTHLRSHWIRRYSNVGQKSFCELGCGSGINLIELVAPNPSIRAVGYETNSTEIQRGQEFVERLGLASRLSLRQADLNHSLPPEVRTSDYVLLIDVLEHLAAPDAAAAEIGSMLKPGASLLVSVPTTLYPSVFGRKFHREVGHLHDGFGLTDLDRFFGSLERVWSSYSTGPFSWPGVALYYRVPNAKSDNFVLRKLASTANLLRILSSVPFRYLDFWNGAHVSCSLFVEYRKRQ